MFLAARAILKKHHVHGRYIIPWADFAQNLTKPLYPVPLNSPNFPILFRKMSSTLPYLEDLTTKILNTPSSLSLDSKSENFCQYYHKLPLESRYKFLKYLSFTHNVDHSSVEQAARALVNCNERAEFFSLKSEEKLRLALSPKYKDLFKRIGRLKNGVKFLVDLRIDVLELIGEVGVNDPCAGHLRALNTNLRELLSLWFSVGFLTLERITWESSCGMLQKVSEYEAVHPMRNWTDLKRRVGAYRRCYVFTHSSMPGEPIVVLHTALTQDISSSIQSIVMNQRLRSEGDITRVMSIKHTEDPKLIKAAIFYSISSTQRGLQGIELGNQLIKRVVQEVIHEFPHLSQFSTLSPIPGFKDWLVAELYNFSKGNSKLLIKKDEIEKFNAYFGKEQEGLMALRAVLSNNLWFQDSKLSDLIKPLLMRNCADYLYNQKHRGFALNNVTNFHLRNGAVLWRLNWNADTTPRGMSNSCGIMVNYRYFLDQTEDNSFRYIQDFHIETSEQFLHLLF